ncbi:MAG: hypothetical protein JST36_05400 [Bacteroidetes bacterium]|nr:hypothetical protein [Bacteroidota bacterium]
MITLFKFPHCRVACVAALLLTIWCSACTKQTDIKPINLQQSSRILGDTPRRYNPAIDAPRINRPSNPVY